MLKITPKSIEEPPGRIPKLGRFVAVKRPKPCRNAHFWTIYCCQTSKTLSKCPLLDGLRQKQPISRLFVQIIYGSKAILQCFPGRGFLLKTAPAPGGADAKPELSRCSFHGIQVWRLQPTAWRFSETCGNISRPMEHGIVEALRRQFAGMIDNVFKTSYLWMI